MIHRNVCSLYIFVKHLMAVEGEHIAEVYVDGTTERAECKTGIAGMGKL